MSFKKSLFFLILGIIGLVIIYNFIFNPTVVQNNYSTGAGMGMHMGGMHNSNTNTTTTTIYSNYIDIKSLSIIILLIISLAVAAFYIFRTPNNRCAKCGYDIKNENWKICPVCGATLRGNGRRKL